MPTSKAKMQMHKLIEQRDKLLAEMEALKNKIAGLELAMSLLSDDTGTLGGNDASPKRGNVKGSVLDLLREAGTTGLNAATAVETAKRRGIDLDRGTVSSLLSRFKRDGMVVYDNDRYKLKEFAQRMERPSTSVMQ
jgi:hypothetical protein